jgi:hypothetical protein
MRLIRSFLVKSPSISYILMFAAFFPSFSSSPIADNALTPPGTSGTF